MMIILYQIVNIKKRNTKEPNGDFGVEKCI